MIPSFPVSFWCGPPNLFVSNSRYEEIKEAGFTLAMFYTNEHYYPDDVQRHLSAGENTDLPVIIYDERICGYRPCDASENSGPDWDHIEDRVDEVVSDWKDSPALYGYFVMDEPPDSSTEMSNIARIVKQLRLRDPDRLAFVNLLPTYGFPDEDSYRTYVSGYIETVKPDILSFDYYPEDTTAGRDGFSNNLRIIRDFSNAHGKPFWVILNGLPPQSPNPPGGGASEAHMRWQAMESLRYGASGILYFTYWSPPCGPELIASITRAGNRTSRYDEIRKLNGDIHSVVGRQGEVLFGRVRSDYDADVWLLNTADPRTGEGQTTARLLSSGGWSWTEQGLPGYTYVNQLTKVHPDDETNGFWLSAREDLANRTFYVGNVLANHGYFYKVTRNSIEYLGEENWDEARGGQLLGRFFDVDGFWVAMA